MSNVGQFVADPRAGTHCTIKLDSGEKLLVSHSTRNVEHGHLSVELWRWMGFGSEAVLTIDMETPEGRAAMGRIRAAVPPSAQTTPIGALVEYIKDCRNAAEVKQRGEALLAQARAA